MLQSCLSEFSCDECDGIFANFQMPDEWKLRQDHDLIIVGPDHSQALHGVDFFGESLDAVVIDGDFFEEGETSGE